MWCLVFVNQTRTGVTREEGTFSVELPPSDSLETSPRGRTRAAVSSASPRQMLWVVLERQLNKHEREASKPCCPSVVSVSRPALFPPWWPETRNVCPINQFFPKLLLVSAVSEQQKVTNTFMFSLCEQQTVVSVLWCSRLSSECSSSWIVGGWQAY